MSDLECPRCKTTRYRNPNLKLMVNICGHSLCENCIDVLFVRGSGACPQCNVPLRRNAFRLQMFEDAMVEKEVSIRKKILKDFNKQEEDFSSLREFNDYLEMVETIIFNLANNIDTEATRQQVEQYKKENQDQIKKNRSKKSSEEEYLEALIEQEREIYEQHIRDAKEEVAKQEMNKKMHKKALIDDLMFSNRSASDIVASHRVELANEKEEQMSDVSKPKITAFSTGIKVGQQAGYVPIQKVEQGELYSHCDLEFDMEGPKIPTDEEIECLGYLQHLRSVSNAEKGGGFTMKYACKRALLDAFNGLFFNPSSMELYSQPVDISMMDDS